MGGADGGDRETSGPSKSWKRKEVSHRLTSSSGPRQEPVVWKGERTESREVGLDVDVVDRERIRGVKEIKQPMG